MRRGGRAFAAVLGVWLTSCVAARAEMPELIESEGGEFAIPFEVDFDGPASERPVLVQLMVSNDQGASWALCDSIAPNETGFQFRAPAPGEFWFAIRSFDAAGRVQPEGSLEPELRVNVRNAPLDIAQGLHSMTIPAGVRPRMVNSRSFEFDYQVDRLESAAVERVELWITTDGGANWSRWGVDEDRQSPMQVAVEQEGLYGFWMVIERTDGVRGVAPRSGDAPHVWIGVDRTPPLVRLTTGHLSGADGRAMLTVHWEATDARLTERPVSVAMATIADGPWTPLTEGVGNTGEFTFALPTPCPARCYIRLTVRDEAGNEQLCASTEPIVIDRSAVGALVTTPSGVVQAANWFHVFR